MVTIKHTSTGIQKVLGERKRDMKNIWGKWSQATYCQICICREQSCSFSDTCRAAKYFRHSEHMLPVWANQGEVLLSTSAPMLPHFSGSNDVLFTFSFSF